MCRKLGQKQRARWQSIDKKNELFLMLELASNNPEHL